MIPEQDCLQCGRCCEKWGWGQKGIVGDLLPWIAAGREDILRHVAIKMRDGSRLSGKDITREDLSRIGRIDYWVDPEGRTISYCPFYWKRDDGKVYCRIHAVKPAVCVGFAPWAEVYHDYGLNCPACRGIDP